MKAKIPFRISIALASALAVSMPAIAADSGVSEKEVRIGMANPLSGPASGLGTGVKAGAEAYIARVNAAGGVHGRKIVLVSLDDGYEPARSAAATSKLIDEDKVFALFGYVGTPTSTAAVPIASKAGVPYLFPFTGAEFLRNPVNKWVFNVRASYFNETEEMVEFITKDGGSKIAVFIQDDAFGEAGKAGVNRALFKRNLKLHAEARYKRNTMDVDEGLAKMKEAQPDAIVFVGTYAQFAALVKKAKAAGLKSKFFTVSFIGTADFVKEAGADGENVYITQVLPSPEDKGVPMVKQYLTDMRGGRPDYTSLEGYVNAMVLVEGLKKAGPDLTRDGLVGALEGLDADIGGAKVSFSSTNHQGLGQVYLTQVKGGKVVAVRK